jgi:peroxiredoxin
MIIKKSMQGFAIAVVAISLFTSAATNGYKIGDTVKDFSLKNVDNKMVSLKDDGGSKGCIVIFTCNHCPYAKAYEQRVIALDKMYRSKGYPVIAINPNDPVKVPDDSFDNMQRVAKEKNYPFPYIIDETQGIARQFGAARTPQVYVLTKTEKGYEVAYIGAIDDNTEDAGKVQHKYVEEAVNALLEGKAVSTQETKAVGCTIKWKV